METHSFTLILSPPAMSFEDAAEALYKSGCDDALFTKVNGEYHLDFDRQQIDLSYAVKTAMEDVKNADIGSRVKAVYFSDKLF